MTKEELKQAKACRMAEAFAALAAGVQRWKEEAEARRSARTALFNQQRFGLAVAVPSYSTEELDRCESWAEVLARRVRHPPSARKELDDRWVISVELDRARGCTKPVGR